MPADERGADAAEAVGAHGQARLRPIQLGLRTGTGVVEILSGLEAGEIVVTEGSDRLADGVPVDPVAGDPTRKAEAGAAAAAAKK